MEEFSVLNALACVYPPYTKTDLFSGKAESVRNSFLHIMQIALIAWQTLESLV